MDSTFWRYARQDLADRFRLVLWDLPGLGKSKAGGGREAVNLGAFATDLAPWSKGRPPAPSAARLARVGSGWPSGPG